MPQNNGGMVTLYPNKEALVYINGREVKEAIVLKTGSRVILGKNHVFRFNHPEQGEGLTAVLCGGIMERNTVFWWYYRKKKQSTVL